MPRSLRIPGTVSVACWLLFAPLSRLEARTVHVDPAAPEVGEDGSQEHPFRRLESALASLLPDDDHEVLLAGGEHHLTGTPSTGLVLPTGAGHLTLRGQPDGTSVIRAHEAHAVAVLIPDPGAATRTITFRDLTIRGGRRGLLGRTAGRVEILGCRLEDQELTAVEFIVPDGGELGLRIHDVDLDGSSLKGIDALTRPAARLELEVTGLRLATSRPFHSPAPSPTTLLRGGLWIFLASRARIEGHIEGSRLLDCGQGIVISGEESGPPGTLDLDLVSNVIAGHPDPARNDLQTGLRLSRLAGHAARLNLYLNSFTDARGSAITLRSTEFEAVSGVACGGLEVLSRGNLYTSQSGTDLSWETGEDGPALPCFDDGSSFYSPASIVPEPRAPRLPVGALVWTEGRGPAPRSGGPLEDLLSPDTLPPELELVSARDARGRCRVSDTDGDGVPALEPGGVEGTGPCQGQTPLFIRGDCSGDGVLDLSDPIALLGQVFSRDVRPDCPDACDTDDDGVRDLADAVSLLLHLFQGHGQPAAPFPAPGVDPTADRLPACER